MAYLPVLQKQRLRVRAVGTFVEIEIKGDVLTMEYEAALAFAHLLRQQGKVAKAAAGDTRKSTSVLGTLTDGSKRLHTNEAFGLRR